MSLSKAVLSLAAKIARRLEQDYADYLESCEQDRREGFRPRTCEHGMNLHVDWDPICGPCEDGYSMRDGVFRRQFALDSAKRRIEKAGQVIKAAQTLTDLGVEFDYAPVWKEIERLMTP